MQRIEEGTSPLKYPHAGTTLRLTLLDTEAAEPAPNEIYFAETKRLVKYSNGRPLKKPRTETTPGALPGAVAWLDFVRYEGGIYIAYVRTRGDMGRKGYARTLINELARRNGKITYDFGSVHSEGIWKIKQALDTAGYNTRGKIYF